MKLWGLLLAMGAAGPAWSQPSPAPAHPVVITNPDWLHKPGPDEFSKDWPTGARSSGDVAIECVVTANGDVSGCVVLWENPLDEGFGEAALKMSRSFRMRPETRDGTPVGGGSFATRIHFTYDGVEPPKWVHRPSQMELQAVWPAGARDIGGQAVLDCTVTLTGKAVGCRVNSESPRGRGFGAAALKLAPQMLLVPTLDHGHPVNGSALLTIDFTGAPAKQTGVAQYGASLTALINAPWEKAPSAADVAAAWPKTAAPDLPEARVRLRCSFLEDSTLTACRVLSEEPGGQGFGGAALGLVAKFRTRGAFMDASVIDKARIVLPFQFTNPKLGGQSPDRITEFNWVRFIDSDRMTEIYPAAAADAKVKTGRGVVDCIVAVGGDLSACAIESEDPPGLGFGQSAITAMTAFTVNPWTDSGQPVDGAKVRVPIRFVEEEPEPGSATAGAPPSSPKRGPG